MGRAPAAAATGTAPYRGCFREAAAADVSGPLLAAARRTDEPSPVARLMVVAHVSSRAFRSHITTTWVRQSRM